MSSLSSKTVYIKKKGLSLEAKKLYFDNSKYLNFVSSSKLEGIKIMQVDQSLEQLIEKYQTIGNRLDDG